MELSDRLYDLSALQALTDELKSETIELVEVIAAESNFTQIFLFIPFCSFRLIHYSSIYFVIAK